MESTISYRDPHASARIQIANYDMENKSTPTTTFNLRPLVAPLIKREAGSSSANSIPVHSSNLENFAIHT